MNPPENRADQRFELESWRVISERRQDGEFVSEATVKLHVEGQRFVATLEGDGPADALNKALALALQRAYPALESVVSVPWEWPA
jgi:2-isopropylmalate synthase